MTIQRYMLGRIGHAAVESGGTLHFSGVIADNLSCGMREQTEQICHKIEGMLTQLGSSKEKMISATIYITDFSQKEQMNDAWLSWLSAEYLPTRATIGVADLGENVLIEVVATAEK